MKTYKVQNRWEDLKKIIRLTLFILLIHIPFNSWPLSGKPPYIGFEFKNRQYLLDTSTFSQPFHGFEFKNRQYLLDTSTFSQPFHGFEFKNRQYPELPSDFIDDLKEYLDILQSEPLPDTKGLDEIDYFHNQWHPTPDWRWSELKRVGGYYPKISDYLKDYYQPTNALEALFSLFILYEREVKAYVGCPWDCTYFSGPGASSVPLSITPIYGRKYILFGNFIQIGAKGAPPSSSGGQYPYKFPQNIPRLESLMEKKFPEFYFYKINDELRKSKDYLRLVNSIKRSIEAVYEEKVGNGEISGFNVIPPSFIESSMKTGVF